MQLRVSMLCTLSVDIMSEILITDGDYRVCDRAESRV